jgi:hypothetical protein
MLCVILVAVVQPTGVDVDKAASYLLSKDVGGQ